MTVRVYWTAESLSSLSTTATSRSSSATLTFTPDAGSTDYVLFWSYELQTSSTTVSALSWVRNDTASTDLAEYKVKAKESASPRDWFPVSGFLRWTSPSSPTSQTFSVQFATASAGTTAAVRNARLIALKLSSDDFYAENTTPTTVTTTTLFTQVSLTVTPPSSGDYLVLGYARHYLNSTTASQNVGLYSPTSGYYYPDRTASLSTSTGRIPKDVTDIFAFIGSVVETLSSSTTFTVDAVSDAAGTSRTVYEGAILALRLSSFSAAYSTESTTNSSGTAATRTAAVTLTQTTTSNPHLLVSTHKHKSSSTTVSAYSAVTYDGAALTEPVTEAPSASAANYLWTGVFDIVEPSAASHTWTISRQSETTSATTTITAGARITVLDLGAPVGTTWSSTNKSADITLSYGNLIAEKFSADGTDTGVCSITISGSSKQYFEVTVNNIVSGGDFGIGFLANGETRDTWPGNGGQGAIVANGDVTIDYSGSGGNLGAITNGDIIQLGVDPVAKTVRWARNNGTPTSDYTFTGWGAGSKTSVSLCFISSKVGSKVTLNAGASALTYSPWSGYAAPDASSGGAYTLTASYGAISLSGQTANLLVPRTLAGGQGAFALSGQDAGLARGQSVVADYGAFGLTGQAAGMFQASRIAADQGSFSLTGQNAGLLAASALAATYGGYIVTGQSGALVLGALVPSDYGTFALTGQDATLSKTGAASFTLTSDYASLAVTGQDAGLLAVRAIGAGYGAIALTGQDAALTKTGAYSLLADYAPISLAGQSAGLLAARVLAMAQGALALSGQAAGLLAARAVSAAQGAFTLTGQDAAVRGGLKAVADYGTFNLSGQDAAFVRARYLVAEVGSFALTGQAAAFRVTYVLSSDYGAYVLTGFSATLINSADSVIAYPISGLTITADGLSGLSGIIASPLSGRVASI